MQIIFFMPVLDGVSIAIMKNHDQGNLGRKEFIWLTLPYHSKSLKEVRIGTQMSGSGASLDPK